MVDRADLDRFLDVERVSLAAARRELDRLLQRLDLSKPAGRAVFLESFGAFANRWGDAFASLGSDFYLSLRDAAGLPDSWDPVLSRAVDPDHVARVGEQILRDTEGSDDSARRETLRTRIDAWVKGIARETVMQNAIADSAVTRFARVPSGSFTCGFCLMLASRGWVYASAESAGKLRKFHAHCDCLIVPAFGYKEPSISGYNPELLEARYKKAISSLIRQDKQLSDAAIVGELERLYPNVTRNSEGKRFRVPESVHSGLPERFSLSEKTWGHIIRRHLPGGKAAESMRFDDLFTVDDLADAIVYAANNVKGYSDGSRGELNHHSVYREKKLLFGAVPIKAQLNRFFVTSLFPDIQTDREIEWIHGEPD